MSSSKRVQLGHSQHSEWLPVARLQVRAGTQRRFNQAWGDKLAREFDPGAIGVIHVAAISGNGHGGEQYIICDGQHRVYAVRKALGEDQLVPCIVIRGVDVARAAQLFRKLNNIRRPRPMDDFLIGVTAKDVECVAINDVVHSVGAQVADGQAAGHVNAVSALRRIYRMPEGAERLRQALEVVVESWGMEPESFNGDVLVGIGLFLDRYANLADVATLRRKLRSFPGGPMGLLGRGRTVRQGFGGTVSYGIARALTAIYNSAKRSAKLPDWNEKRAPEEEEEELALGAGRGRKTA